MPVATLINIVETYSSPPQIIGLWTCPNVPAGTDSGSDSTSLVVFELPAKSPFLTPYYTNVEKRLRGKAYAIDLRIFNMSSKSDKYTVKILNKNDIALLDTVYEVACYCDVNKTISDISEDPFTIRNRDVVLLNRLYFYFDNTLGSVDTGPISVELTYLVLQDRDYIQP